MSKAKKVNGKDLMLWIGGKVIALSNSCTLTITASTSDGDTKDSGIWSDPEVVGLSFSASNQSVYSADADRSNDLVYADLFDKMIAGEPVSVSFGIPSNKSDQGLPSAGWTAPATGVYLGNAIITNLEAGGNKGSDAACSVSLQGVGALNLQAAPKS